MGLAKCVHVAPLALSPIARHKVLPLASPIELLTWNSRLDLDWHVPLCSTRMRWKPLGYGDKVVLVQYYFPLLPRAVGTSSFICVLVLRKGRTQTAQMEQFCIYLFIPHLLQARP